MAVAGPLDEAGVRSSVNGQILAFTDDYPTHRCTVVGWRFTRRRLLGKGVNDVHRRGGRGDILTILRLKSWKWGLSSADI